MPNGHMENKWTGGHFAACYLILSQYPRGHKKFQYVCLIVGYVVTFSKLYHYLINKFKFSFAVVYYMTKCKGKENVLLCKWVRHLQWQS